MTKYQAKKATISFLSFYISVGLFFAVYVFFARYPVINSFLDVNTTSADANIVTYIKLALLWPVYVFGIYF